MGNCQAAEAATVVIQHPGSNKIERIYWSVTANQIMNSNPGHYVALVVTSPTLKSDIGTPVKQLKLLRPDDTLLIGNVYRLISFEDMLTEFATKKCGKLGKLLKERGGIQVEMKNRDSGNGPNPYSNANSKSDNGSYDKQGEQFQPLLGSNTNNGGSRGGGRHHHPPPPSHHQRYEVSGGGQWRPALQSIAEIGT